MKRTSLSLLKYKFIGRQKPRYCQLFISFKCFVNKFSFKQKRLTFSLLLKNRLKQQSPQGKHKSGCWKKRIGLLFRKYRKN